MPSSAPKQPSDDLLTGFERTGSKQGELRAYLTTAIAGSLYVFDLTFHAGSHHAVFYSELQRLTIVALVILIGIVVIHREVRVHWWLAALFALPGLQFVYRLWTPTTNPSRILSGIDDALTVINLLVAPILLWVTLRLLAPEYFTLPSRKLKMAVVGTIAFIGVIGYLAGVYNYTTLTCQDFIVAGDDPPANCLHHRHP
jgi:hypothetical protein